MRTIDFPISQVDLAIGKSKRLELSRDLMDLATENNFRLTKSMSIALIKANHTKSKEFANPDNSECWQKYLQSLFDTYNEFKSSSSSKSFTKEDSQFKFNKARLFIFNNQLLMSLLRTKSEVSVTDDKLKEVVKFDNEPIIYNVNWKDIIILSAIYSIFLEDTSNGKNNISVKRVWGVLFPNKNFEEGFAIDVEKSVSKFAKISGIYLATKDGFTKEYQIDNKFYFDGSVDLDSGKIVFKETELFNIMLDQDKRKVWIEQKYLKGRERTILKQQLWSYLVFRIKIKDKTPISINWLWNGIEGKATPTIENHYNESDNFKDEFLMIARTLKGYGFFQAIGGKHNLKGDKWTWKIEKKENKNG